MQQHFRYLGRYQTHAAGSKSGTARRGVLSAWAAGCLMVSGLCTALVINHLWLSGISADTLRCTEAAALAAGQTLLCDEMLRKHQNQFETDGRLERARETALMISECYARQAPIPRLKNEGITFSFPQISDVPCTGKETSCIVVPKQVSVQIGTDSPAENLKLFFSGLTRSSAAVRIGSSVHIEHHPTGFHPGNDVPVPMLPFAVPDDHGACSGPTWSRMIEQDHGGDCWSWNSETQTVEQGPDGLPELTLSVTAEQAESRLGQLQLLNFTGNTTAGEHTVSWIQQGLTSENLHSLGLNQIEFPQAFPVASISPQYISSVADALGTAVGKPSVVCLIDMPSDDQSQQQDSADDSSMAADPKSELQPGSTNLIRPVAARIMRVRMTESLSFLVTLQPCVLCTSTAVMNEARPDADNRYVYNVRLLH
jgi:hypothetical protein